MRRLFTAAVLALTLARPLAAADEDHQPLLEWCSRLYGTPVAASPVAPAQPEEPDVVLCAETTTMQPGEIVWVLGATTNLGLPIFQIKLRDAGMAEFVTVAEVDYANHVRRWEPRSRVLELVAVCGERDWMAIALRARTPGKSDVQVVGLGEVRQRQEGRDVFVWGSAISAPLPIEVEAAHGSPAPPASPATGEPIRSCSMTPV